MLSRHKITIAAGLAILTALTSACTKSTEDTPGKAEQAAASGEPVELVFFSTSRDSEESFDQRFGEAIRKKFPNYTIRYIADNGNTLDDLMLTGQSFDIHWDSIGVLAKPLLNYNFQYDMTGLIQKHQIDLSRIEEMPLDAMRKLSNGGLYGLPVTNNNLALFYNKDLFDKFGVPYPKDGMTWDDILDLAQRMSRSEGGVQYIGLGMSPLHMMRMNELSVPYIDPKTGQAAVNTEPWKKLFQSVFDRVAAQPGFKEFVQQKNYFPGNDLRELTKDKVMAMSIFLSGYSVRPKDMGDVNWDMVSLPTFKDAPTIGSQAYPTYFSVTKMSKHKDEAAEVIKYLTSDEYQMEMSRKGMMTILKDQAIKKAFGAEAQEKVKNYYSVFVNQFAATPVKTKYDSQAEGLLYKELFEYLKGTTDLNSALRKAEEEVNKMLAEEKAKSN
ncbi:extracellular solute-binding protein [Paenibacillus hemerocallicola]|uniref:Extracellular solute-binding protein n=1 Tax=Paenibacillus hemerocallicola TaxID=1172614 RepID=A0A5C4TE78_9BACL|nr:extracellular solute-binding protein [Paenibacillus hemerocallicola]TNJ67235.1 extracellular solute-binding protein [Paenibacillus hemerocallicola]